jgi:DNA-binding transcriptional regulator YiaG
MTKEQILKARRRLTMTQEEFAAAIGVRGNTVYRWEAVRAVPHPIIADKIEKVSKQVVAKR